MSAFTEDMLKSMAKVEATRAQRLHASIERFTAEEKDELLKEFHPDYSSKGFKVLNERVGLIYGDSITLGRARDIMLRLVEKGFASSNVVYGIGSFTYQCLTRDTFGFALKAIYAEVDGEAIDIYKDPATDDGTKKSAKGLLRVEKEGDDFVLYEQQDLDAFDKGALVPVFRNSQLLVETTVAEIRERLMASWECPEAGSIEWRKAA